MILASLAQSSTKAANQTWIGGTGNWTTNANWTPGTWLAGNLAIFNPAPGTITVGTQTAGGLTFDGGGYILQSGKITFNNTPVITVASGVSTFATSLSLAGSGGISLRKSGGGAIALATSNSSLGTTSSPAAWTIDGGTLNISKDSVLGANPASLTNQLTFAADSRLQFSANIPTGSAIGTNRGLLVNNGVTATFDTQSFNVFTNNAISDQSEQTGTLKKIGSGTLYLGNNKSSSDRDNAYLKVAVAEGTLVLNKGKASTYAVGGGGLIVAGGTVRLAGSHSDQIYDDAPITLAGGTFDTNGLSEGSVSVGAPVQGLGAVTLAASSVIDLGTGASVITFADSSGNAWESEAKISIWNWSGHPSGGGADAVFFGANSLGLTNTQLGQIAFYSDSGTTPLGAAIILSNGEIVPAPSAAYALDPFLKVNGLDVRNGQGTGDIVPLRGVNLGGWLLMEGWMVPMDSSGLADQYSVIQTLDNRFGVVMEQALVKSYQDAWITTQDLDRIKAMGLNVVRLPFWWANLLALDGSWRADAFVQMDWLINQAWQRGLYTFLDFHGVPGGQSISDSTGRANQNQYWSNSSYQAQTVYLWQQIAAHYNNNPAVAGYDLMNEPYGAPSDNNYSAVWNAYDSLYRAIRAVDPSHIIIMEGTFGSWSWSVLPPPTTYGWTNVIYEMHEYQYNSDATGIMLGTTNQITDFQNHASWNVPAYVGEFNDFSPDPDPTAVWQDAVRRFNASNISWSVWSYKAIHGSIGDSWGLYDPIGSSPPAPNIQLDSASTIASTWGQCSTQTTFGLTPMLQQALGAPLAAPDSYAIGLGAALSTIASLGVIANDQDINLSTPGLSLSALLINGPAHGQLTLQADGAFSYTPTPGFNGVDTFRYRLFDNYVTSTAVTTASIQVGPPFAPNTLTALAGDSKVTLTWTDSASATSYKVKRAQGSGGPYAIVASVTASGASMLSYSDTSVVNGCDYYYVVSAGSAFGAGGDSIEATARPAQTFAQWIAAAYPGQTDPLLVDPSADPDRDGLTNLAEYFFGTSASTADSSGAVTAKVSVQGDLIMTFRLSKNLVGVSYSVQESTDLVTWQNANSQPTILSDQGDYYWMQKLLRPPGIDPSSFGWPYRSGPRTRT